MAIRLHYNKKILFGIGLILIAFYYIFISDYPEEIVEVDRNFKLDSNAVLYKPGMKVKTLSEIDSHPDLKRGLKKEQHEELVNLLKTFAALMENNNISYVMFDGTLLGSYFFHDFVPWDDDLDLMVAWKDRDKVLKLFSDKKLRETYGICSYQDTIDWYSLETLEGRNLKLQKKADLEYYTKRADFKFKFFLKSSKKAGAYEWNWPFVDIKYYMETEDTVYKLDHMKPETYTLTKQEFFPLHLRPFADIWLLAPRDTRAVLRKKYKKFTCVSHTWNHIDEISQYQTHVSCKDILSIYPHVHRSKPIKASDGGVVESLMVGQRLLHSVIVDEPWYNVSGYYDLK